MKIGGAVFLGLAMFALISRAQDVSSNGGAGFSAAGSQTNAVSPATRVAAGRALFLKNCAHCHAADAHGDEGPDLHKLDLSDEWIASRIRKGKAGEMTAFAGKLQPSEINTLVAYVQTLK
jgi:mono/diheme cytochrome c family protein